MRGKFTKSIRTEQLSGMGCLRNNTMSAVASIASRVVVEGLQLEEFKIKIHSRKTKQIEPHLMFSTPPS
jgi:hypothetical protein